MNTMKRPRPALLTKLWEKKFLGNRVWQNVEGWGGTYVLAQYLAFIGAALLGGREPKTPTTLAPYLVLATGALAPVVSVTLSQPRGNRLATLKTAFVVAVAYQASVYALLKLIFFGIETQPSDEGMYLILPLTFGPYIAWWPIGFFARWKPWGLRKAYEKRIFNALKAVPGAEVDKPNRSEDLTTVWISCGRRNILAVLSYEDVIPKTDGRWKGRLPHQAAQYVDYEGHDTVILLDEPTGSSAIFPAGERTYVLSGGFDAPERFIGQIALLCKRSRHEAEKLDIGQNAEHLAADALRKFLPEGWQLYTSLWLPELQGEVDLVVMAPGERMWIIEVKSYAGPVTYRNGELWRNGQWWEGVMNQLRKQMRTARAPVVLWQPRANDAFDRPIQLEGKIYHHRGNPKGLVKFFRGA